MMSFAADFQQQKMAEFRHFSLNHMPSDREPGLYEAFPPEEARCLAKRLDIHHTPKHGSWLKWPRSS